MFFKYKSTICGVLLLMTSYAFLTCNNSEKKIKTSYPIPPDTMPTFDVKYNGRNYLFYNREKYEKFIDSLHVLKKSQNGLD